jgi:hypothetical protein
MSMLNIKKGFRQYSPAQLRDYCYSGVLSCGTFEINEFIEYIFQDVMFQDEFEKLREEIYDEGYQAGESTGDCNCRRD